MNSGTGTHYEKDNADSSSCSDIFQICLYLNNSFFSLPSLSLPTLKGVLNEPTRSLVQVDFMTRFFISLIQAISPIKDFKKFGLLDLYQYKMSLLSESTCKSHVSFCVQISSSVKVLAIFYLPLLCKKSILRPNRRKFSSLFEHFGYKCCNTYFTLFAIFLAQKKYHNTIGMCESDLRITYWRVQSLHYVGQDTQQRGPYWSPKKNSTFFGLQSKRLLSRS